MQSPDRRWLLAGAAQCVLVPAAFAHAGHGAHIHPFTREDGLVAGICLVVGALAYMAKRRFSRGRTRE